MDGEDYSLVSSHLVSVEENIAPNSRRTPIARPGLAAYNYYSCVHSKPCYSLQCFSSDFPRWCPRRDLNPHVFRHYTLNVACLPIPSLGHIWRRGEYFTAAVCNPHWELRFGYPVLTRMTGPLGGDSGTRTHTTSRSSDFESDTSTNSIISPC